jgi:hypothetical protein
MYSSVPERECFACFYRAKFWYKVYGNKLYLHTTFLERHQYTSNPTHPFIPYVLFRTFLLCSDLYFQTTTLSSYIHGYLQLWSDQYRHIAVFIIWSCYEYSEIGRWTIGGIYMLTLNCFGINRAELDVVLHWLVILQCFSSTSCRLAIW